MTIANEIAAAHSALEPAQAALVIYRALFEQGPQRMNDANRLIAVGAITGGLIEWRRQLVATYAGKADAWEKKFNDAKAELDEVKIRLAILEKER